MDSEQNVSGVEVQELEAQPILSIRTTIVAKELGERMGEKFEALGAYLKRLGVAPAGPPFVIYHTFDWEADTDFEVGVPVGEKVAGEGGIDSGELPAGPVVSTVHTGPHPELGKAYERIHGWLKENGKEAASPLWEVYYWMDLGRSADEGPGGEQHVGLVQPYK